MEEAARRLRRASEDKRGEAGIIDPGVVNRAVVGSDLSSLVCFSHTLTDKGLVRQCAHYGKSRAGPLFSARDTPNCVAPHFASKHPMTLYLDDIALAAPHEKPHVYIKVTYCEMEDMVAGGNLSSESQHDGHDVDDVGGGVDDMRSDPYRPRSLARPRRKSTHVFGMSNSKSALPARLSLLHRRTDRRTLGGVSQRAPFSLFFGWWRGTTEEACANYTTGF